MVGIEINGTIKVFENLPSKWGKQHNYPAMDASVHYIDGFREVVYPAYNSVTQRIGAMFFDIPNDVFTYTLVDKTPEEIEIAEQRQLDNDTAQQLVIDRKRDGELGLDRIFAIIERKYRAGEITAPQAKAAVEILYPLVEPLYKGLWIETQRRMNVERPNIPALLLPLFTHIETVVDDYVIKTYQ